MNNIYDPFYEVTSNTRELTESEKELQQLAKFMYENFPEYETASEESFSYKAIRILESLKSQLADTKKRLDEELNMNFEKSDNQIAKLLAKNKALEKQLADIKYLSREEVEKLIEDNTKIYRDVENKEFDYFHRDKFLNAICNLAIPDIKQKREGVDNDIQADKG